LPPLEHHTYRDVEEGGIKKRKKINFVHENGKKGKKKYYFYFIFIPNHHFWMSEGSLNKVQKNICPMGGQMH
jgi:hypothetical protein